MMTNILEVHSVHKRCGDISILEDINLEVKVGELIVITGKSGSGKTSLLQIIGLLKKPSEGTITVCNKICSNLSDKRLSEIRKKNIGYVYQDHNLLSEFSVLENASMSLLINNVKRYKAQNQARELIEKFNIPKDRINNPISTFSGGEKQRIAIIRATIHKPALIISDEPTGNLDYDNSEIVFKCLMNEARKNDSAVILATHNDSFIHRADKSFTLDNKKLIQIHSN